MLIGEQLSTISSFTIVYTLCIVYELSLGYSAAVPFVSAVFLRGFIVNGNSDSAINDRCADLLRALPLLFYREGRICNLP